MSAREPFALGLLRKLAEAQGRSGYFDAGPGALRYTVRGPEGAPELLVLHGLSDSIAGWARPASALARRHRLHLLDLPGHGLSDPPADHRLESLLCAVERYALQLQRPSLVGHSLGGWLALKLALRHPERVRELVLINPGGASVPEDQLAAFRALVQPRTAADARRYLAAAFHRPPLALRLLPGEIIKAMHADNARGFLGALEAEDFFTAAELRSLRVPVRLLWGRHDKFLPEATLGFFRAHLPGVRVELIEDAAHCPHLEVPAALARAIVGD